MMQAALLFLSSGKKGQLPLRDEPVGLWPVLWVVVKEACRDLQRGSLRQPLPIHHTVLLNFSGKPLSDIKPSCTFILFMLTMLKY